MTAPTEQDIREAIRLRNVLFANDKPREKLQSAIEDYATFMYGPAVHVTENDDEPEPEDADDIWHGLSDAQGRRLWDLYERAVERAVSVAEDAITEVLVEGGLTFAREYPDAARAHGKARNHSRVA